MAKPAKEVNDNKDTESSDSYPVDESPNGVELWPKVVTDKGYVAGKQIAEGGFSRVYEASNSKLPGKKMAVKVIIFSKVGDLWVENCLRTEMRASRRLQHENIIKVYDIIKTKRRTFIFMEKADQSVEDYMRVKKVRALEERVARNFFVQMMRGLKYMHSMAVAHRDLKLENLLLDSDMNLKITDFGLSCFTIDRRTNAAKKMTSTYCGTTGYRAPEVKRRFEGDPEPVYDPKVADIFSAGVILFELLTFIKPWPVELDEDALVEYQVSKSWRFPKRPTLSPDAKELIKLMLEPDPKKRPSASQVLANPWTCRR